MTRPAGHTIRRLGVDDAAALTALRGLALRSAPAAFGSGPGDDRLDDPVFVQAMLADPAQAVFGAFAEPQDGSAGSLAGFVGVVPAGHRKSAHRYDLWGMFVGPDQRRRGIGRALAEQAIEFAGSREGVSVVALSVTSEASEAAALYRSLGFVEWGWEPDALRVEGRSVAERHMRLDLRTRERGVASGAAPASDAPPGLSAAPVDPTPATPATPSGQGTVRTASCSCGRLTVTTYGEPLRVSICHCLACQRRTGSVFAAQARFPRANVEIRGRSTQYVRLGDEGNRVVFNFCPECGATVHYAVDGYDDDNVAIPVGAFADPGFPPPTISVYDDCMHAWVVLPEDVDRDTHVPGMPGAPAGGGVARSETEEDRRDALKEIIRRAFAATPPPDATALRGSDEGEEPYLLEEDFRDVPDWRSLGTAFLDQSPDGFGSALSFFSAGAFRYYLPAYLLADVDEVLQQADPLFHLWYGLDDAKRGVPVNELRYGEWTWFEAISGRFAGFTRDELEGIVAYLRHKAERDELSRPNIEQALRNYWLPRLGEAAT